jgi:hypothetical protein
VSKALIGVAMIVLVATLWSEWRRYQSGYWQLTEGQETAMRELIAFQLERWSLPAALAYPRYRGRSNGQEGRGRRPRG